jgi:hypothetical protein
MNSDYPVDVVRYFTRDNPIVGVASILSSDNTITDNFEKETSVVHKLLESKLCTTKRQQQRLNTQTHIRIMGKQGSKPKLFAVTLFLGDVIFAVTAALTLILLLYYRNDGQLRAPAVLGMACGFFAFKETLGRMVEKLEKPLSRLVKRAVRLALSPLLWTGRITARAARFLWRITVGKALSQSRERQTERVIEDLRQAANRGFDLSVSPEHSHEKK